MISKSLLKPGDQILLERGNTFTDTLRIKGNGTEAAPITIGAYGKGADPVLSGAQGIAGSGVSHVVVKGLTIANTASSAIYAANVTDWTIDHVTLKNTGLVSGAGGIILSGVSDFTISNSTFTGVHGDGIYATNVSDMTVAGNSFAKLEGVAADGVQLNGATDVLVKNNTIDMASSPNSTKGGVIVENANNVDVIGNDIDGGSFGVHVLGHHVVIADNDISGQLKYDWSAAVLIGGTGAVSDYDISGNTLSDTHFGVALTAPGGTVRRDNIHITDNVFEDIDGNALKVNQPSTGTFIGNVLIDAADVGIRGNGKGSLITMADNVIHNSAAAPVVQAAVNDVFALYANKAKQTGWLMDNDNLTGGTSQFKMGGQAVDSDGIRLTGAYGVVDVTDDGHFTYRLAKDAAAKIDAAKAPVEHFSYQVTDALGTHSAELVIDLAHWNDLLI